MRLHRLIARFLGSSLRHDEAVLLLPWYANGTLQSPERRRMQHHVCRCESCRAELASLEFLRHTLRQLPMPVIGQTAFDSLMTSIERSEQEQRRVSAGRVRATVRPARGTRFGWFAWFSPTAMVPAAAAAGLLLAITLLWWNRVSMRSADYRTLGAKDPAMSVSDRDLRVVFEPGSNRSRIEALVESVRGRIVDGPSDLGVYTIRIDAEAGAVTLVADRLRTTPQVSFAEPAVPPLP